MSEQVIKQEIDGRRPICEVIKDVQRDFPPLTYVAFVRDQADGKFYAISGLSLSELQEKYHLITGTVLPRSAQ